MKCFWFFFEFFCNTTIVGTQRYSIINYDYPTLINILCIVLIPWKTCCKPTKLKTSQFSIHQYAYWIPIYASYTTTFFTSIFIIPGCSSNSPTKIFKARSDIDYSTISTKNKLLLLVYLPDCTSASVCHSRWHLGNHA